MLSVVDGGGRKTAMHDTTKLPLALVPRVLLCRSILRRRTIPRYWRESVLRLMKWAEGEAGDALLGTIIHLHVAEHGEKDVWDGLAAVLQHGAAKYGMHNWRRGMPYSYLVSAALRHAAAVLFSHEVADPDSGLPHRYHFLANIMFLMEYTAYPLLYARFDDRYRRPRPAPAGERAPGLDKNDHRA